MSGPKKEPRKACNDRLQPAERPRPLPRAVRNPLAVRRLLPVRIRAARALYGARLARTGRTSAPAPTAGPSRGSRGRGQRGRRRRIHPGAASDRNRIGDGPGFGGDWVVEQAVSIEPVSADFPVRPEKNREVSRKSASTSQGAPDNPLK